MNPAPLRAAVRPCPSCGAALNAGAITCSSCGGLVVVESILGRLKGELRYQIVQINDRLRKRELLLWVLALCPLVILPPVLAVLLSFRRPKRTDDLVSPEPASPDVLIVIVAVCNIILSVLVWRWIGDTAVSMGLSIGMFLKSIGIGHPPRFNPSGAGSI